MKQATRNLYFSLSDVGSVIHWMLSSALSTPIWNLGRRSSVDHVGRVDTLRVVSGEMSRNDRMRISFQIAIEPIVGADQRYVG